MRSKCIYLNIIRYIITVLQNKAKLVVESFEIKKEYLCNYIDLKILDTFRYIFAYWKLAIIKYSLDEISFIFALLFQLTSFLSFFV